MTGKARVSSITSFLLLPALMVVMPTAGQADTPPLSMSTASLQVHPFGTQCADADLIWSPKGMVDDLVVHVTVRNELGNPVAGCEVRLDIEAEGDPTGPSMFTSMCGPLSGGSVSFLDTCDANGVAAFDLQGGGCGRVALHWTVNALCAAPEMQIWDQRDTLCVKSPDFNGDGMIQFLDTFRFLPMLTSGHGYCGDLNCDGEITFLDVFRYLPHLHGGINCPSHGMLPSADLGDCP